MKTQISIIIPVYNDPEGLHDTVQSLVPQVNGISEIIISDNNSTDKTSQVGMRYAEHPNISYIEANELQSSYYARNQGIEQSTGDILIFIDANVKAEEGFITSVHRTMNETDCDYMGCNIEIIDMESSVGLFSFSPTCCLVVTRELIDDIGNSDERLISGGDLEFGVRANNSGYPLHFQPDITLLPCQK
jgi:glycosyltransferase involved in cell wall biosynthesis